MKNLTAGPLIILRQDSTRVTLPAAEMTPRLVLRPAEVIQQGSLEILVPEHYEVDFTGIDLDADRVPFVVTREVFNALPEGFTNFVTPDLETAILNGLKIPHLIRRFIAKPGYTPGGRNTAIPTFNNQQYKEIHHV